ncbi:MAG: protein kinase [Chloroflexi bacterium]|nr:protein kinase [Chloroflexota bacterium]
MVTKLRYDGEVTVYLAQDAETMGYVVLNTLPGRLLEDNAFMERFEEGMRAASSLFSPHIMPVLDYGVVDGVPFTVRPFFASGTLEHQIRINHRVPLEDAVNIVVQLADELDYAHEQGHIHFGVNPGVILRDDANQVYMSDFGVAKVVIDTVGLPLSLRPYTAPEVFLRLTCGHTVDIYSLGAILFEMLSGQHPVEGFSHVPLKQAHDNNAVPRLDQLGVDVPDAVQGIIDRALDKLPNMRYQSASQMAADLAASVYGEAAKEMFSTLLDKHLVQPPTGDGGFSRPRPVSTGSSSGKHSDLVRLYADALMIERTDPQRAVSMYRQVIDQEPQFSQGEVIERLHSLEQDLGLERIPDKIDEARRLREHGDWDLLELTAREVLSYDPDHREAADMLEEARVSLATGIHYRSATVATQTGDWPAFSLLARELYDNYPDYPDENELLVLHVDNGEFLREQRTIPAHDAKILAMAFTNEGDMLATGATDRMVKIWRFPEMELTNEIPNHSSWVCNTAFSPDGLLLLSASWDGQISLWERPTFEYYGMIAGLANQVRAIAFANHDDTMMATAAGYFLTIWTLPVGKRDKVLREPDRQPVTAMKFAPHDARLVTGINNGNVRVRDMSDPEGPIIKDVDVHGGPIYALDVSPDGTRSVTTSRKGTVKVIDLETGERISRMQGHKGPVRAVAFSPDGTMVATGGRDLTVRVWGVEDGRSLAVLKGHTEPVDSVALSPDGRYVVSSSTDGTVKLWALA